MPGIRICCPQTAKLVVVWLCLLILSHDRTFAHDAMQGKEEPSDSFG